MASPQLPSRLLPRPEPKLEGKVVLVVGSGNSVWDDLANLDDLVDIRTFPVVTINDMGTVYPEPIAVYCTLHPEKFRMWQDKRNVNGLNTDYLAVTHERNDVVPDRFPYRVDRVVGHEWSDASGSGSSGLYAVKVALALGAARVVLAGVPLDANFNHFNDRQKWHECSMFQHTWEQVAPRLQGKVKSLSGFTKNLLGEPTFRWLRLVD